MSSSTIPEGDNFVKVPIIVQPFFLKIPRGKGDSVVLLRQQVETVTRFCANCFSTPEEFKRCTVCKKAFYCNRDCQVEDWKIGPSMLLQTHQSVCKLLKEGTELGEFYQKLNTIFSEDDFKKELISYQGISFAVFNNPKKRTYVYKVVEDSPYITKQEDTVLRTLNGLMIGCVEDVSEDYLAPTGRAVLCPTIDFQQLDPNKFGRARKVLELFNVTVAIINGLHAEFFPLTNFHPLTVEQSADR